MTWWPEWAWWLPLYLSLLDDAETGVWWVAPVMPGRYSLSGFYRMAYGTATA